MFKSLNKLVPKNPIELANLDKIVEELVKRFDDKLKVFIEEKNAPMTTEAAAHVEQRWIDELNNKYDEKAHKSTGDKVAANWKEGNGISYYPRLHWLVTELDVYATSGKENVDVRKRMLNREFDKRRGKVFQSFGGAFTEMLAKIDRALAIAEEPNQAYFQFTRVIHAFSPVEFFKLYCFTF